MDGFFFRITQLFFFLLKTQFYPLEIDNHFNSQLFFFNHNLRFFFFFIYLKNNFNQILFERLQQQKKNDRQSIEPASITHTLRLVNFSYFPRSIESSPYLNSNVE